MVDIVVVAVPAAAVAGIRAVAGAETADADLAASFASEPSSQSATCTGTSTCNCTIIEAPDTLSESGTYSTSGNSLLTTPTGSVSPDTVDYCVKGSTLTFREPVMEAMQSGFMAFVAMKS